MEARVSSTWAGWIGMASGWKEGEGGRGPREEERRTCAALGATSRVRQLRAPQSKRAGNSIACVCRSSLRASGPGIAERTRRVQGTQRASSGHRSAGA
eukprot:3517689-Rhodomonas_salina.1